MIESWYFSTVCECTFVLYVCTAQSSSMIQERTVADLTVAAQDIEKALHDQGEMLGRLSGAPPPPPPILRSLKPSHRYRDVAQVMSRPRVRSNFATPTDKAVPPPPPISGKQFPPSPTFYHGPSRRSAFGGPPPPPPPPGAPPPPSQSIMPIRASALPRPPRSKSPLRGPPPCLPPGGVSRSPAESQPPPISRGKKMKPKFGMMSIVRSSGLTRSSKSSPKPPPPPPPTYSELYITTLIMTM